MKTILFFVSLFCSFVAAGQQPAYFQQSLTYRIDAELDDKSKKITAFESLVYRNNSPSTLTYIWFHIWPKAYNSINSALYKQYKHDRNYGGRFDLYFGTGDISDFEFKINDKAAVTEKHPEEVDILKLVLNEPLKPGDSITITTPFTVKLPQFFSRGGFHKGEFMGCQWYPKPAVFDKDGWHEMPYLDMGEYYSEFGDYTVNLKIPSEYVVAATGTLQNREELEKYKTTGRKNTVGRFTKPAKYKAADKNGVKTLTWIATAVPDFAWFADKDFIIQYDTLMLSSGRVIDAFSYYYDKYDSPWKNSIDYVKDATLNYSNWIGEYAYPVVQAVEGPDANLNGGMEYPMVTIITSPLPKAEMLDGLIAHEIGHNWFMGFLGSNERLHTWMDEGLNTYYEFRYQAEKYRANSAFGANLSLDLRLLPVDQYLEHVYEKIEKAYIKGAIETPSDKFDSDIQYMLVSYYKSALWLYLLEVNIGRDKLDLAMQHYFNKWKFKHPQPEDMKAAFEEAIGGKLDQFFELTKKEGKF